MLANARSLARRLRRRQLMLCHRNLAVGYGTTFVGTFSLDGGGTVTIGENCRLVDVRLCVEGDLVIGDGCFLNGAAIVCKVEVRIGPKALISDAYITDTDFHNIEPERRHQPPGAKATRPVAIGRNVWLGDRAVVLKGSRVGNEAVVGSHSVVRGTIPERAVCIGNPARVVRYL